MRIWKTFGLCVAALTMAPTPALAEVTHVSDQGFAVLHVVKINASPDKVWSTLIAPQSYWQSSHSWSGDAGNMYLDAQAGGCFCEKLPVKAGGGLNSVEHMRVIYAERPRVLRMTGALGPLQSEGVVGTMNVAMEADGSGTKISMSYVVGGFMRMNPQDIAPAVDAVIGEQLLRLKAAAEGRRPDSVVWPPKKADAPPPTAAKSTDTPLDPSPKGDSAKIKPVADKPKDAAATSDKPSADKPAAPELKPPLSERLKAADEPTVAMPSQPDATPAQPAPAAAKKKPIVEDAPKKKPTVTPGTR